MALVHKSLAAWRYWVFFALKTLLLAALFAVLWIELTTARSLTAAGFTEALAGSDFAWLFLIGSCFSRKSDRKS